MVYRLFQFLNRFFPAKPVYAHCDIPCGVYDPASAHIAARGVYAMLEKMQPLKSLETVHDQHDFIRMVKVKEEQADVCKKELLILWTDYFKQEHLEMFPDLHEIFWKAAKQCSAVKRTTEIEEGKKLLELVKQISDMFRKAEEAKHSH
ncbi:MAG: superoxide dismutase, Ni [Candidatus Yanofskybacteria bacterium]|nr:superoxide dismutase, Ni [Candidatus Yanofskybacteria bacterium]